MNAGRFGRPGPVLLLVIALGGWTASAQQRTEESVLASLLRTAARETIEHVSRGEVELRVIPEDAHPIPRQIFSEEFASRDITVRGRSPQVTSRVTVDLRAMNSSTTPHTKSSYFRTVTLTLGVLVEDNVSGAVAWSKSFDLQRTDTLAGVPAYEERDFREIDDPTWMESILLPVLTGAAALVVVVLLFTVRGS